MVANCPASSKRLLRFVGDNTPAKGSVAVNGVSLTVATLEEARFSVMIIPFTWIHTSLGGLEPGAQVNLECDMVGKYVARAAQWYRRP